MWEDRNYANFIDTIIEHKERLDSRDRNFHDAAGMQYQNWDKTRKGKYGDIDYLVTLGYTHSQIKLFYKCFVCTGTTTLEQREIPLYLANLSVNSQELDAVAHKGQELIGELCRNSKQYQNYTVAEKLAREGLLKACLTEMDNRLASYDEDYRIANRTFLNSAEEAFSNNAKWDRREIGHYLRYSDDYKTLVRILSSMNLYRKANDELLKAGLDTSLAKEMNWNADTGIAAMDYNGHIVALKDGKCLEWECPISIESQCFTECLRYSDSLESLIQMSRSTIPAQLY